MVSPGAIGRVVRVRYIVFYERQTPEIVERDRLIFADLRAAAFTTRSEGPS